jgi:hypothetical protein
MDRFFRILMIIGAVLPISFGRSMAAQIPEGGRLRAVLPADGLVGPGIVSLRDQAALNDHYFIADEKVLRLDGKAEAVFARYRLGGGEALVLAVAYQTEAMAAEVYARFGRDFFAGFDPKKDRVVEALESGDAAGAFRVRAILVFVLEAPDRKSCEALLRRIEEKALALF